MKPDEVKSANEELFLLVSIWSNDVNKLKKLLKSYDPNKLNFIPALSAANLLNRKKCKEILLEHKADQSYAKLHDLLQSYCLFLDWTPTIKIPKRLANNVIVEKEIKSSVIIPAYSIGLIQQGLEAYSQSRAPMLSNPDFKITKALLTHSLENNCSNRLFFLKPIFENIKTNNTTYVNSGWENGKNGHAIGVIFHKDHLIVGNGTQNKIAIYPIKQNTIKQADVKALLCYASGSSNEQALSAHQELIAKITHNKKPIYQLKTTTQGFKGNCSIFSPLSALEGLWYLLSKEKGASHEDAANHAKLTRNEFHQFMKQRILDEIKNNHAARKLVPYFNVSVVGPLKLGIVFGVGLYLCMGLITGVFTFSFALIGLAVGFSGSILLSMLANRMEESSLKSTTLSKSHSDATKVTDRFKISKNDPHYLNMHKNALGKQNIPVMPTQRRASKSRSISKPKVLL